MKIKKDTAKILDKIGFDHEAFINEGMQAIVVDNGDGTVSKIYKEGTKLMTVYRLKEFYDSLITTNISFKTPKILEIYTRNGYLISLEEKLEGETATIEYLKHLDQRKVKHFVREYVKAMFDIKKIESEMLDKAEILDSYNSYFIPDGRRDWNKFLFVNIENKIDEIGSKLTKNVKNFKSKVNVLLSNLENSYLDNYKLVHGDYFPANLLVDEHGGVIAVLDFGILTTKGDYLFDVATGWVFVDMYRQIKNYNFKKMVYDRIRKKLSVGELKRVRTYVLVYSIVSANMYSKTCDDGHYAWCVSNLNDVNLWT